MNARMIDIFQTVEYSQDKWTLQQKGNVDRAAGDSSRRWRRTNKYAGEAMAKAKSNRKPKGQKLRDFWYGVKSTGDWSKDQELGSTYTYLVLQAIKAEKFQPLLGWIVLGIIKYKCPKHIAVGFFQTVADIALGLHQIPDIRARLARSVQS